MVQSTTSGNDKHDCVFSLNTYKNLFNIRDNLKTLCQSLQWGKELTVFFNTALELDQPECIHILRVIKGFNEQRIGKQLVGTGSTPDGDVYNQAEEDDRLNDLKKHHGCFSNTCHGTKALFRIPKVSFTLQDSRCEEITSVDPEEECHSILANVCESHVAETVEHPEAMYSRNSAPSMSPLSAANVRSRGKNACRITDSTLTTPVGDTTRTDTKSADFVSTGEGPRFLDNSRFSELLVDDSSILPTADTAENGETDTFTCTVSPVCKTSARNHTEGNTLLKHAALHQFNADNYSAVQSSTFSENKSVSEGKVVLLEMAEKGKVDECTNSHISFDAVVVNLSGRDRENSDIGNVAEAYDEAVVTKTVFFRDIPVGENKTNCKILIDAFSIPSMRTVNAPAVNSALSGSAYLKADGERAKPGTFTACCVEKSNTSTLESKPQKARVRMSMPLISKETQQVAILIIEEKQTDLERATNKGASTSTVRLMVTHKKHGARSCTVSSFSKAEATQSAGSCKSDFRVCTDVFSTSSGKMHDTACKFDGQADWQLPKLPALDFVERLTASVVVQAYPLLLQDLALGPRSELWRLCTFSTLIGLPVSTIRLARSGFYYAQNRDDIQCFSCGARKRHWDNSEQDVYRFHFPDCTHAHSSDTTNAPIDNIAAAPHASSHERNVHVDMQHDGGERQHGSAFLQTGQAVSSREPVTASASLSDERSNPAESGSSEAGRLSLPAPAEDPGLVARHRAFAAQSAGTAVPMSSICPLSTDSGVAFSPNETVDGVNAAPSTYMKQFPTVAYVINTTSQVPTVTGSGRDHFEYCRFPVQATQRQSSAAQTYGQPSIGTASTRHPSSLHEELGEEGRRVDAVLIQLDMTRAASRHNATARDRLASFVGWLTSSGQTPRTLALAGFYYLGSGDSVRCWYCGIILRNWRSFDDPWVTHVLFRFSCGFVIAVRGQNFVTQALVVRGHEHTSLSPAEFSPFSGSTDGLHSIQAAAILHDQVRSARLPEESGSATSTLGGQREWGQTASNSPINASDNASNSRNISSNRADRSSVNNNDISKNGDCIQGPLAERNATSQRPSGSEADRKAIAQWTETVTASNSNVGESRSKTRDEEGIATRHENPPEVPDRESGSAQNNTSTGSGKAAREIASGESGRRKSAQSDAQSSRGRDQGSNFGNDTSVSKGPGYQSEVGAAMETSSDAGRFAIETDGSSAAAPSRDNSPRRPDSARGKRRGNLFGKWRKSKSKSSKKVIQQTANTAEDNSQPNRSSSQIHEGKVDPAEQRSGQSTPSRGPGGTDASGKHDVKGNKKEKERKQSEAKKNMASYAENGQTESSTSRIQNSSYGHAARLQAEINNDHVMTASNERQTSSPHAENSTSDLTNASYERQTTNLQNQSRASHVDHVSRERRPTDQLRNHASQMLQVDSEAHDSVHGPSWKESTLPSGPDITSSATETRGTLQRQTSTVPEPSGCRPVSEPPLLHNMEPADRDALYRRLQEENQRLRARRTCRICGRQTVDTIFLPCGHICSCETCASTVRECCLCFQRIRGTAHVYLE